MMPLRGWGSVLVWLATASPVVAQQPAPEIESIRTQDLRADLFYLAGDGFRGRLTNTPENQLAAEFIRARFERLGLEPAGPGGSYYQAYPLMTATLGPENRLVASTGDGVERRAPGGGGLFPHPLRGTRRGGAGQGGRLRGARCGERHRPAHRLRAHRARHTESPFLHQGDGGAGRGCR